MDLITIYHPGMDRETDVPAAAVQHWRLSGWQEGPRPDPSEQADQQPVEQADAPEPTPHAPRRSRTTERSR